MYNNQPTKFQIKIHNGSKKKNSKIREKNYFMIFLFVFLCFFFSLSLTLSYSLPYSLHCFILHIIFHFFSRIFHDRKSIFWKHSFCHQLLVYFVQMKNEIFFFTPETHTHTQKKWENSFIFFVRDDFNSNYMDILIIYLCIFH